MQHKTGENKANMIRLGLILVFLAMWLVTKAAYAHESSRVELLSRSSLKIVLPTGWTIKRVVDFEDEVYYISDASGEVLIIDFGNVPDVDGLRRRKEEVRKTLNGEKAVEFHKDGLLADVILEPRCGEARYAWLHRIPKDLSGADSVTAVMRSIACVNQSKELETSGSRLYR